MYTIGNSVYTPLMRRNGKMLFSRTYLNKENQGIYTRFGICPLSGLKDTFEIDYENAMYYTDLLEAISRLLLP